MDTLQLTQVPVTRTGMLIRKPAADVFQAFVDPAITTKFWFTHGSGRIETGKQVLLEHGAMLNLVADRYPKGIEEH